jgi:hypothetical protein
MRYVLVTIFICAAGLPEAFALPTVNPNPVFVSKAEPIKQAVRRNRSRPQRHSSGGGGIHPLVGSGSY